jgi:hypothetical protein
MSESSRHMRLVSNIVNWIRVTRINEDLCIFIDGPNEIGLNKPPNIGGYQPDVFAKALARGAVTIIGEAKTAADLETNRSELQLMSYLSYLKTTPEPFLVISTGWVVQRTAKGLLCRLREVCEAPQVKLVFLTEMPPIEC